MSFNNDWGVGYYKPDYFCGILPEIKELRREFNIGPNLPKDKNIGYKVEKQGMNKEPDIPLLNSIEIKIENYRW